MLHRLRSPQVMLLIETSSVYGRELIEGIGRYAAEHGPWSIYHEDRGLLDRPPPLLKGWHGDGIIARSVRKSDLKRLLATGLPIVELFADFALSPPAVCPNEETVGKLAIGHFLDRGLRNAAFFANEWGWWIDSRRKAFRRTVEQCGTPCRYFELAPPEKSKQRIAEKRLISWLKSLPKPCGVFCVWDVCAIQVTNACRRSGLAVPEQVAVLGVDNDPVICSVSFPPLSSIDLGGKRVGYEAAALLNRMMSGKPLPRMPVLVEPGQVITRESTDIMAVEDADVAQAVRLIREHARRGLRVSEIAEAVGLSRRSLQQRFRAVLKRTPKEELTRVRIDRAKMLLVQTDLNVEQVSRRSGFAAYGYFVRAFRRETGLTPRHYRKKNRITELRTQL
ncbi:MAG: substrate-binding domain-containing protein [Pirellulaceae bacterium]|nr:substrate-binding domain-containing protein [Pirellulaceae bacterium]